MSFETKKEQALLDNFNLLCKLLAPKCTYGQRPKADLSKIEEIINKKIPDALSKNAPPDYYDLYTDFVAEYEKLRDYILYDRLIGKSVIALGGGFSSGKSTFLNVLTGWGDILPTEITPTTAVPTYLVHDSGMPVTEAINIFDVKEQFDPHYFQSICHNFGQIAEESGEILSSGTPLGHILESVFVAGPLEQFQNIAFLDTPGYSKADSKENYSARTDEQIARRQLSAANYILWFINCTSGDIVKNDIDFLRSIQKLRPDVPIAVILTRADERESSILQIKEKVQRSLTENGLGRNCQGVFAYARDVEDGFDMPQIQELLSGWNQSAAEPDFSLKFKRLFIRCSKYYESEVIKTESQLHHLRTAIMRMPQNDEAETALTELSRGIERQQKSLKAVWATAKELQQEFFQELKYVGDQVHIRMPEPGDAELWNEGAGDPLALLREYNEKNGTKPNPQFVSILQDALGDVKSQFQQSAGGSEYSKRLLDIMRENCKVKPAEIRFNDIYQRTEAYQKLVRTLAPQTVNA